MRISSHFFQANFFLLNRVPGDDDRGDDADPDVEVEGRNERDPLGHRPRVRSGKGHEVLVEGDRAVKDLGCFWVMS